MYKSKTNTDQCHKPSNQSIVPFDPNDGMYFKKKIFNQYKSILQCQLFLDKTKQQWAGIFSPNI